MHCISAPCVPDKQKTSHTSGGAWWRVGGMAQFASGSSMLLGITRSTVAVWCRIQRLDALVPSRHVRSIHQFFVLNGTNWPSIRIHRPSTSVASPDAQGACHSAKPVGVIPATSDASPIRCGLPGTCVHANSPVDGTIVPHCDRHFCHSRANTASYCSISARGRSIFREMTLRAIRGMWSTRYKAAMTF